MEVKRSSCLTHASAFHYLPCLPLLALVHAVSARRFVSRFQRLPKSPFASLVLTQRPFASGRPSELSTLADASPLAPVKHHSGGLPCIMHQRLDEG